LDKGDSARCCTAFRDVQAVGATRCAMPLVFGLVPDTVDRLLVFAPFSARNSVDTNDSIEENAMSKPQVTSDVRDEKRGLLMGMNL
jgi:hypothetical protein